MNKETKKLLAELAMLAVGQHQYAEAESIALALDDDADFCEIVATIRSLSLMNQAKYQDALNLLEPLAEQYPDLICFIVLCADQLDLAIKKDFWLEQAQSLGSVNLQAFVRSYLAPQ